MDMKVSLIVSDIDGTLLPAGCRQDGTEPDGPGVSDGIRHLAHDQSWSFRLHWQAAVRWT